MKKHPKSYPAWIKNLSSFCCLLLVLQVLPFASFAQTPSTDINTYILFANKSLGFKGRDCSNCPQNGVIQGGNVGVNACAPVNGNNLTFGGPVTMPNDGEYVVGARVRIENSNNNPTSIWQLFARETVGAFDPSILRNPPVVYWDPCPLLNWNAIPFPLFVASSNPADDRIVPTGGSLVLGPGTYRNIQVKDGGRLTLLAGIYNLNSFHTGQNVDIFTEDGTEIRIAVDLTFSINGCFVGPSNNVKWFVRSDGLNPNNDVSVGMSKQIEFHGDVFAPNGHLNLGHASDLWGHFWANTISSDWNVSIHYFEENELPCANPCEPPEGLVRDPEDFILFAYDQLIFKGGNQSAGWGNITGNIGVNYADKAGGVNNYSLVFGSSGYAKIADGFQAVANNVRADASGSFYDLYANELNPSFAADIRHLGPIPFTPPIFTPAQLPPFPFTPCRALTNSASDLTIAQNAVVTIPVGDYRDVRINDNARVTFQAGTYNMRDLSIGKKVIIIVSDLTILQIDYAFKTNDNLSFGEGTLAKAHVYVGSCGSDVTTTRTISFSKSAEIHGWFFAPYGFMDIGGGNNLYGHFWAERISGDPNDNVFAVCDPPCDDGENQFVIMPPKYNQFSGNNSPTGTEEDQRENINAGLNDVLSVYPNPFTDQTNVEFTSSKDMTGILEVFDIMGRRVSVIYNGHFKASQEYKFRLNSSGMLPGMYIVRLNNGTSVFSKSMIRVK